MMFPILKSNIYTIRAQVIKRWQINLRYPLAMIFWFISPILWLIPVLIFGNSLTGSRYSQDLAAISPTNDVWVFTAIGIAYINFMYGINWTAAYAIREEEFQGTLESIYVTPPSKSVLVLANGIYALSFNGLSLLVQMVFVSYLLGGIQLIGIIMGLGYLLMAILMVQGLSMLLSSMVLTFKQGWRVVFTIQILISLFTPAQFPLAALPAWMFSIAVHSPFTIAVQGFRNSILVGYTSQIWVDWIKLLIWAVVIFVIGLKLFNRQDISLRTKGKLGKY